MDFTIATENIDVLVRDNFENALLAISHAYPDEEIALKGGRVERLVAREGVIIARYDSYVDKIKGTSAARRVTGLTAAIREIEFKHWVIEDSNDFYQRPRSARADRARLIKLMFDHGYQTLLREVQLVIAHLKVHLAEGRLAGYEMAKWTDRVYCDSDLSQMVRTHLIEGNKLNPLTTGLLDGAQFHVITGSRWNEPVGPGGTTRDHFNLIPPGVYLQTLQGLLLIHDQEPA